MLPIDAARTNAVKTDWDNLAIPVPWFLGRRKIEPSLAELVPFVDWTPVFAAHGLDGRFPEILEHPLHGARARHLHERARQTLDDIVRAKRLTAHGVYGFWAANSVGDDIVVYKDDARVSVLVRFHMLRQQAPMADGHPNRSLADFVAPKESFAPDYIGAYAVTAGIGLEDVVAEYEARQDERAALVVMLGERLTAAFAEFLHVQARHDWGYARHEQVSHDDLIDGKYRGIRAAFGDPACPDLSERGALFRLLHAPEIGITLADTFATSPTASASGLYFAHPDAALFDVGPIGRDQLEDYAARKGVAVDDVGRWLS